MKPSPRRSFGSIEPLEARIAPASIIKVGAPDFPTKGDINYSEAPFVNMETSNDSITAVIGRGAPGVADTFYLRLSTGDEVKIFDRSSGFSKDATLKVNSGNVIAFFQDKDLDNEVDDGELISLSLGKDASVTLRTGLEGSVVTNFDEANNTVSLTSLISSKQGIKSLFVGGGGVPGSILAGGNITNVTTVGPVGSILAGTAANGATFDIFPNAPGGEGTISFAVADGVAGSSISKVVVNAIGTAGPGSGRIQAGDGGDGAAGGSLSSIRVTGDTDGFSLIAGNGGVAPAANTKAGAGGSITGVLVSGVADPTNNSPISMLAGNGGDAAGGVGGRGGAVSNIKVGFEVVGTQPLPTSDRLADNLRIESGFGGSGRIGGAGGAISALDVLLITPAAADPAVNELSIVAGNGGASNVPNGKAGPGGSINDLDIQMLQQGASTLIQAGAAGAAGAASLGAAGGSITNLGTARPNEGILSTELQVLAGNGSSGKTGGAGGRLGNIFIGQREGVVANSAIFNAGIGGDGAAGNAGAGGSINTLRIDDGDFRLLNINSGTAANGGNSIGGRAGVGGSVTGVDIIEGEILGAQLGAFLLRSGDGGDGNKGGAAGGSLKTITFAASRMNADVRSGAGGDATGAGASGKGGAGGVIQNVQIDSQNLFDPEDETTGSSATVTAGAGGFAAGRLANAAGGAGGSVLSVTVRVAGSALVAAGDGGNGDGGAAGRGGSIVTTGAFADNGAGQMIAGDAGVDGAKPGAGGSILGTSINRLSGLYAATDLTLRAGDGTNGGAGGSIRFTGYGSTASSLSPTPTGNILVQAGQGSAEGRAAGAGGSIDNVNGSVSSPDLEANPDAEPTLTLIAAGDGVSNATATKSAAGGSISNMSVFLGGGPRSELRFEAGDAGDGGASVRVGAKGGDVRNISVFELTAGTTLRAIAAGDGGDAGAIGGQGGTIQNVKVVNQDIGVRIGQDFGYTTMGGLFAGVGGNAAIDGRAGSVIDVSASAIAAIVAGRAAVPQLVERVDLIYVATPTDQGLGLPVTNLLRASDGDLNLSDGGDPNYYAFDLNAYLTNNLVGAVKDPTRVDANKFTFVDSNNNGEFDLGEVPIDGLVMAKVFNQANTNFIPEARLIGASFYDYNNFR